MSLPQPSPSDPPVVALASTTHGRLSRKPWKSQKSATVYVRSAPGHLTSVRLTILASSRSHLQEAVKTKKWDDRMHKTKKAQAIKMLRDELKEEKQAELQRCAPSQPLCVVANTPVDAGRSLWSVSSMPKKNVAWRRQKPRCAPHTVPVRLSHSSIRLDGRAQSCPPAPQGRPYKED